MRIIDLSSVDEYSLSSVAVIKEATYGQMLSAVARLTIGDQHFDQVDGFQFIDIQTGDIVLVLPAWGAVSP